MEKVTSYNFDENITPNTDFHHLYSHKRRDANFAAVFRDKEGSYLAIRDHLGTVPLYYRKKSSEIIWSFCYNDLLETAEQISTVLLRAYLGFPSAKVTSIVPEIEIVPPGSVIRLNPNGSHQTLYEYRMRVTKTSLSKKDIVRRLDDLLTQAVKRLIVTDEVGLYLSGGMDSGLLGYHLTKSGVKVNAYTALPWGKEGSEYQYSLTNAKLIGVTQHYFIDVETKNYPDYLNYLPKLYKTPHGTTTSLSIAALWNKTPIAGEKQLFFAQNTDTFTSSVPAQVNAFITSLLPKVIRKKYFHLPYENILNNYLHLCSRGKVNNHEYLRFVDQTLDPVSQLAQAGMYVAHTQADSEGINAPSIARSQLITNPYYDLDLIEFYLGIPMYYKLFFKKNSRTFLTIEKNLLREIGVKYFPKDLVYRKKGFVLPRQRDELSVEFYKKLESTYGEILIKDQFEKLSAAILNQHLAIKK